MAPSLKEPAAGLGSALRRNLSLALPFLGIVLFCVIVWRTGPGRILDVFRTADVRGVAANVALIALILVVRGLRWRVILRRAGVDYSLWRAMSVWAIGFCASSVTPAKAGDVLRALYVRRDSGRSFGQALVTVFLDRLWDLVFVLVAGLVSVAVFSRAYIEIPSTWIVVVAASGLAAMVFVATRRELMERLLRPVFGIVIPARFRESVSLNFHGFYDSLQEYGGGAAHVPVVLLTALCWGLIFLMAWSITQMLHIPVSLGYMVLIMPLVTLVELLPVSVSGLGTRDATVIYFFSVVGVGDAAAVGFSIAYLIIGTYVTAFTGFVLWLRNPVRMGGDAP